MPDGERMSFIDEGPRTDDAVLFLHGNPTWSFLYRDLIPEIATARRCVAPDFIGMGLSSKPAGYGYRLEDRIGEVDSLVKSLGLRRIHLVVHDWGGVIGLGWAVRHPELVGRIVIMNTAAFLTERVPSRIAFCRTPILGEFIVRGLNGFAVPATRMAMKARKLAPDERKGYLFPYDSWASRIAVHRFVMDIPMRKNHPSRATLDAVAARLSVLDPNPKLILWGGRDFCFDDVFLARWKKEFPQAEVDYRPEAGHYVLDDAGPTARRRIRDFLNH
jgi:haloalkane dehalogenase